MDSYQYVYKHIDPRNDECVYVGRGSGQRAWMMRNSGIGARYGHRSSEHYAWFRELEVLGYHLGQIVSILKHQLSPEEVKYWEKILIEDCRPRFNKMHNPDYSFRDVELVARCKALRVEGLTYEQIGKQLGVATMTAYRNINV